MKDGILIGVFVGGGYFSINTRGMNRTGRPKLTPVARAPCAGRSHPFVREIAEDYGGRVIPGKGRSWTLEITKVDSLRRLCQILSSSPYPLPSQLEEEVRIMIWFLGFETRPGPSQDQRVLDGRFQAYYAMKALKGR